MGYILDYKLEKHFGMWETKPLTYAAMDMFYREAVHHDVCQLENGLKLCLLVKGVSFENVNR